MTGWWAGDGDGADLVGGRVALPRGDATWGPGLVAETFTLDGAGDFFEVPHDAALDAGTGDFTVDLWVRYDSTAGEQVLVEKYVEAYGGPAQAGWTLTKLASQALFFGWGNEGAASPPLSLATGQWYFVVARRQGTQVDLFVDGTSVASNTVSLRDVSSGASLKIGHRGNPVDTPGSTDTRDFWMHGQVDELELFVGTALDGGDIAAIYTANAAGKCKPGVVDCTGQAGWEPSALDLRPGSPPLVVRRVPPAQLALEWEDTGAADFTAWTGTLSSLRLARAYDHGPAACHVAVPRATLDETAGDGYFLVTSRCGGVESSCGRASTSAERPAGAPPCP